MVNRDPVNCETVWQELSNYLEGDVDPMLRSAMDEHFRTCARCVSVLEGTRNVIRLYGDERMMEVPAGFGRRLEKRLALGTRARSLRWPVWSMWLMPAAALALIILAVPLTTSLEPKIQTRSPHAQPGHNIPPDLQVLVTDDARVFHVAGCTFIHNKATVRTITAQEAEREGYMPCLRCMRKYLEIARTAHGSKEFAVHVAIAAGDGHGGGQ